MPPNAPPSDTPPSDAPPSDVPPNAAWPFARCLTPQHDATAPPPLNTEHRTLRHRPYGPPPQAPGGRRPPRRSGACRIWCRKGGGDVESRAGGGRAKRGEAVLSRSALAVARGFRPRCHSNTQHMDTLPGQRTGFPPPQPWHAACPYRPMYTTCAAVNQTNVFYCTWEHGEQAFIYRKRDIFFKINHVD